jgi:hypothetical protein
MQCRLPERAVDDEPIGRMRVPPLTPRQSAHVIPDQTLRTMIRPTLLPTLLWVAVFLAAAIPLAAQAPAPVARYIEEPHDHDWYVEQAALWQQEIERATSSARAWFNYYRAVRYAALTDSSTDWSRQRERVEAIAEAMERAVPNTAEYHLVRWAIGGNDRSLGYHLERALELSPPFDDIAPELLSYYELGGEHDKVLEYAKAWYDARTLSPSLFEYTTNVLASLEPNAVLFTGGDLDTYPIWVLQAARGLRPDVTVINTSLMLQSGYTADLLKDEGIGGDTSLLNWDRLATKKVEEMQAEFIRSVATSTTDRPVYVALTVDQAQTKLIENDLYVVGLANRYSPKRLDNVAMLERVWKTLRLDYLDGAYYSETYSFDTTWLAQLNMNYVAPALLLFEHCSTAARTAEAQAYRDVILRVARAAGQEKELEEHLRSIAGQADSTQSPAIPMAHDTSAESAFARSISVYPNPAARQLTVTLPVAAAATLRLVGIDGIVVRELATSERTTTIDLANVAAGSYLLKVTTADAEATKRVEVKR